MTSLEAQIVAHKDLAGALADWAQALVLFAGAAGVARYFREKTLDRRNKARELYTQFMAASLANPELYGGAWSDGSRDTASKRQKYVYYLGGFLWAAEELLREFPGDETWEETIRVTIREHRDYFASDQFQTERAGYSDALIRVIRAGVPDA